MSHVKRTQGFTLVELLLAMSFIAALLLTIATVTLLISQVYNRGLTVKEVNQISRVISDDLLRDVSSSPTFSLDAGGGQYVNSNPKGRDGLAPSGRLCLGTYSYVWNYGWALKSNNSGLAKYNSKSDQIRLVRIPDGDSTYCAMSGGVFVRQQIDAATAVELISGSDHDLALHNFEVTTSSSAVDALSGQRLYALSYTIGTNDQNALQKDAATGQVTSCKASSLPGADTAYCTIQQFSLVARTQYGVN